MIRRSCLLLIAFWGTLAPVDAQSLTWEEAVQRAMERGPDFVAVRSTWAAARALDAQTQARAGLTLTSSAAYQTAKGINDPVSDFKLGTAASPSRTTSPSSTSIPDNLMPQQASGTLTVALPTSSLAVTGTETFQALPDGQWLQSTTAGLTFTQTLLAGYWGGTVQVAADKSSLTVQSAALTAQTNRNRAVLAVTNAYLTLLAAQDRLAIYTQTLAQRQEAFKFTQARAQLGTVSPYDLKVAQTAVRSAELDLVGGTNALATARIRLANLLGQKPDPDLTVAPVEVKPAVSSLDEAIATGLKNRTELQALQLSIQSAAIDVRQATGALVPTVALTGTVNWIRTETLSTAGSASPTNLAGAVTVRVTPPTIDSGSISQQIAQATTQQSIYQAQLDQLSRSIPVDIQDAWASWQLNGERLDLAQAQVDNADVNRQILKSQFDSGAKAVSDWLTAEIAYSTARLNLVASRLAWQQAAANLQNTMGL